MAEKTKMSICSQENFKAIQSWEIPHEAGDTETRVLYMVVSQDLKKIACAIGNLLIKDTTQINNLVVYKQDENG